MQTTAGQLPAVCTSGSANLLEAGEDLAECELDECHSMQS